MAAELLPLAVARRRLFQRAWQLAQRVADGALPVEEIVVSWNTSTFHLNEVLLRAARSHQADYEALASRLELTEEERESARTLDFSFLDGLITAGKAGQILLRYWHAATLRALVETAGLDRGFVTAALDELDAGRQWQGGRLPRVAVDRAETLIESAVEVCAGGRRYLLSVDALSQGRARLIDDVAGLIERSAPLDTAGLVAADDSPLRKVLDLAGRLAVRDVPVLVLGETGTGKELVARMIHRNSPRRRRPFVPVNCSTLERSLAESRLFGHVKGSFTGADRDHPGFVEEAAGGTLFLDEVQELPEAAQAVLLRFLQEGSYRRVGENRERTAETRVVAASNRNLRELVRQGEFREDLYFRLNVVAVRTPPLRERRADIPLLARFFLRKWGDEYNVSPGPELTPDALACMLGYAWPGNVRELENTIRGLVCLYSEGCVTAADLPEEIRQAERLPPPPPGQPSEDLVRRLGKRGVAVEQARDKSSVLIKALAGAGPPTVLSIISKAREAGIRFEHTSGRPLAWPPEYSEPVPLDIVCLQPPAKAVNFWAVGLEDRLGLILAYLSGGALTRQEVCRKVFGLDEAYLQGTRAVQERLGLGNPAVKHLLDLAAEVANL